MFCASCGQPNDDNAFRCLACGQVMPRPGAAAATASATTPPPPRYVNTAGDGSDLIPTSNPKALAGYYCGVFSLLPAFGVLLGPAALVLGSLGLTASRALPRRAGRVHAIVALVLGGLSTAAHLALGVLIAWAILES